MKAELEIEEPGWMEDNQDLEGPSCTKTCKQILLHHKLVGKKIPVCLSYCILNIGKLSRDMYQESLRIYTISKL